MPRAKPMPHQRRHQQGYGLVVVAALFTAFALIAATVLDRNTAMLDINRNRDARLQLTRLAVALEKYAYDNNNRVPCPASEKLLFTNASFGAPETTYCYTGQATGADTSFLTGTTPASKLLRGMVPVKVLAPYGIRYEDAFDPWGTRIAYIVHRDATYGAPKVTITSAQRPVISDYITLQTISPGVDLILISFGRDRAGGYSRAQTSFASPAVACPSAATPRRQINCASTNSFVIGPLATSGATANADYFDDTLSFLRFY